MGAKLMKTKKERDLLSKKRQKIALEMKVWERNVEKLEADPASNCEKLAFARAELRRCGDRMTALCRGEERQRVWGIGHSLLRS